jgi:molecular chaperone HscB
MSDHFSLFGLPRSFALDEKALQQKYLKLQREFHPDRAAPEQKLAMLQKSADINEAYRILKNPIERAEYLLGETKEKPSQTLLMEAMEQREELAEANTSAALDTLKKANQNATELCLQSLTKNIDTQTVLRLKYLTKFAEELRIKTLELV